MKIEMNVFKICAKCYCSIILHSVKIAENVVLVYLK